MILHKDEYLFKELLEEASSHFTIPVNYIEKDYWVTRALKLLSESELSEKIVFKGGTSLSKAHHIIQRFSEDTDLAVLDISCSGNQIKSLLKKTEKSMVEGLSHSPITKKNRRDRRFVKQSMITLQ